MPLSRPPRPSQLIDALDAMPRSPFSGSVWRTVRESYDVLRGARSGGRWDDGTFDVLYTSLTKDGSIAERLYHLAKGLPVVPSKPKYLAYEIRVTLQRVLDISEMPTLIKLGIDSTKFGSLSYLERESEYPTTQQIGEIASFLEFDGILVPSARANCSNLVIFTDQIKPGNMLSVGKPEIANIKA